MRIFECPKCGEDISESYQHAEPDVGLNGGWFCDKCNEGYADTDDGDDPDLDRP